MGDCVMEQKLCPNCGSQMEWNEKEYRHQCPYCGSVSNAEKSDRTAQANVMKGEEALVCYIEQKLAAGEFQLALSGCDSLLRKAPQMGYAHALRCCARRGARNVKQLAAIPLAMERDNDFLLALTYSSGDTLRTLQTVAQQSKQRAEERLRPLREKIAPLKEHVSRAQAKLDAIRKEEQEEALVGRARLKQGLIIFLRIFVAFSIAAMLSDGGSIFGLLSWVPLLFALWQCVLLVRVFLGGQKRIFMAPWRGVSKNRCLRTLEKEGEELKKLETQLNAMLAEQMRYVLR